MPTIAHNLSNITNDQVYIAFNTVLKIIKKWGCNAEEQRTLLALRKSTFYNYQHEQNGAKFSPDLIERLSYVLNIHAALRILFTNDDSVYGWVRKKNNAPFYNGKTALDIMLQGRVRDLWEVASRLNAERGGRN